VYVRRQLHVAILPADCSILTPNTAIPPATRREEQQPTAGDIDLTDATTADAAVRIQAAFRGHRARKNLRQADAVASVVMPLEETMSEGGAGPEMEGSVMEGAAEVEAEAEAEMDGGATLTLVLGKGSPRNGLGLAVGGGADGPSPGLGVYVTKTKPGRYDGQRMPTSSHPVPR